MPSHRPWTIRHLYSPALRIICPSLPLVCGTTKHLDSLGWTIRRRRLCLSPSLSLSLLLSHSPTLSPSLPPFCENSEVGQCGAGGGSRAGVARGAPCLPRYGRRGAPPPLISEQDKDIVSQKVLYTLQISIPVHFVNLFLILVRTKGCPRASLSSTPCAMWCAPPLF